MASTAAELVGNLKMFDGKAPGFQAGEDPGLTGDLSPVSNIRNQGS
jgi:hypothetical protein